MVPIRAGFFWQGCSPADEQCDEPEKPGRAVELPAFRIGKLEVTQQQYDGCVSAGRCTAPTADFDPLPKQADTFRGFRCAAAE
jgi:formylglycine-generating enzyme required for sulfatase activity